jgi:hypothetical protein
LRDWKVDRGDIRADPGIAREILEYIQKHQVRSVAMTDGIIGRPHQEGIYYEGEWCPICEFWHGRDRFTGHRVHQFCGKIGFRKYVRPFSGNRSTNRAHHGRGTEGSNPSPSSGESANSRSLSRRMVALRPASASAGLYSAR